MRRRATGALVQMDGRHSGKCSRMSEISWDAVQWKAVALLRFSMVRPPLSQHDANTSIASDLEAAQCGQIHSF